MESQTQEPIQQDAPAPKKSNRPYFIAAGLVILLAAAAFVAMRYFTQQGATGPGFGMESGPQLSFKGPDGAQQSVKLDITPAEELPKTKPETRGMFVERKDNSIFVGTGNVMLRITNSSGGGDPKVDADYSGDKVEVVVSRETKIYRDTTQLDPENPGAKVQQTVELGTIDDITPQSSITVWGRKAGDRVIADVLIFSSPFVFHKGAP